MEKLFDISYEKHSIKSKIYCNDPRDISRVIVSCHGFGGSKENSSTRKMADTFLKNYDGVALLTFDWPCHGEDVKQKLRLADCNDYIDGVVDHVRKELGVEQIYLQATSFGGYLTLKYIDEHEKTFEKAAFRSPAVHMRKVLIENHLGEAEMQLIHKGKYVAVGFERKIRIDKTFLEELAANDITERDYTHASADLLVMNGTKDKLVSHDDVKAFCEKNEIAFESIEGADHNYQDPARMRECIDYMEILFDL